MRLPGLLLPVSLLPVSLLLGLAVAPSCTSGGDGMTTATVVLTDAPTDDLDMFEVDVEGIVLHRANGSDVSVMTRKTRIDFTDLTSVSELMVGASVPAAVYTGLSMTIDFASATVCLVSQTTPATVLDVSGSVLNGDVVVRIDFQTAQRPDLVVGRNHLFVLDLELDQALTVDSGSNEVTFSPVLSASVDPTNPRPVRLNGILTDVDTSTSTITIQRREVGGAVIGNYRVSVAAGTVFHIDGVVSTGPTGISAIGTYVGQRTFVQGVLLSTAARLVAGAIETGAGVPGNGQDWLVGHITARDNGAGSNATLTVRGFSVDESSNVRRLNTTHEVEVDVAGTRVLMRGMSAAASTGALNVGQLIMAFGTLDSSGMTPSLDATGSSGVVRMLPTDVWGIAAGAAASDTLTLNLTRIGLRTIPQFDFTVGGSSQSTPTAYDVDVSGLSTAGITTGSKVRARGFVNAVGVVGDDDLDAGAVVDLSATATLMVAQWFPASATAVTSATATSVVLDVSAAGVKVVGDAFASGALASAPAPTIEPAIGIGLYRIVEDGSIAVFLTFDAFAAALEARVGATSPLFRIAAFGSYDSGSQTLSALIVSVILS